eukprot:gene2350-3077_t
MIPAAAETYQTAVYDEFTPACYTKIYGGSDTCEHPEVNITTSRKVYDAEADMGDGEECASGRYSFFTHVAMKAYAGDVSWRMYQQLEVPYSTQETQTLVLQDATEAMIDQPQEHVVVSVGGERYADFEERTSDVCLEPGNYRVEYVDKLEGNNRPGGDLDKTAESHGWFGGTWSLWNSTGCGQMSLARNGSQPEEILQALLTVDANGAVVSKNRLDGCKTFESMCTISQEALLSAFTSSASSMAENYGISGWTLSSDVCSRHQCVSAGASIFGTNTDHCCHPISGELSLHISLNYTGEENHIPVADTLPRKRYLGINGANRMLAGMLLTQTRFIQDECDTEYDDLAGTCCNREGLSTEPYGVDPVFLISSELYSQEAVDSNCCNISSYTEECMPPERGDFYKIDELAPSQTGHWEENPAGQLKVDPRAWCWAACPGNASMSLRASVAIRSPEAPMPVSLGDVGASRQEQPSSGSVAQCARLGAVIR